jgi:hypothetical protein
VAARGVLLPLERVARWRSVTVAAGGQGQGGGAAAFVGAGGPSLRHGDYGGLREDPYDDPCAEWRADPRGAVPGPGGADGVGAGRPVDAPAGYARATRWSVPGAAGSRYGAGSARLVATPPADTPAVDRRAAGRLATRAVAVTQHLTVTVAHLARPGRDGG